MCLTGRIYHPEDKHPEPYQHEMDPHANEGQNRRDAGPHPEKAEGRRSAYDVKELHRQLDGYNDADLKQIPVLPAGHRLEAGATYINLRDAAPREFTGAAHMEVGPDDWIVPKAEVPYPLWNRLIGIADPERLDRAIAE